jgi:tetratricopeptide (TPR) repeat protein
LALLGLMVLMGCAPRAVRTPSIQELERSAAQPLPSSDLTALEQMLVEDFQDNGRLDRLTLAQASLVVSGATDREALRLWQGRYEEIRGRVAERLARDRLPTEEAQARTVFQALHETVFTVYATTQSSVLTLLEDGTYNCLSATLLFNSLLEDLSIRTAAVLLPTHTYSVIWVDGKRVEVETTHPKGFEPFRSEIEYLAFLRSRGLRVGVDTADPVLMNRAADQMTVHNRVLLSYVYINQAKAAADGEHLEEEWKNARRAAALVPEEAQNALNRDAVLQQLARRMAEDGQVEAAIALLFRHLEGSPVREALLQDCAVLAVNEAKRRSDEGAPHRGEALLGRTLEKLRDAHAPSDLLAMVQERLENIYRRLAELAAGRGDTEELERIFVSAISRLPDEPRIRQMEAAWIHKAAARVAEDGQVEAAIALLLRHLEGSPARETLLQNCAVLALNEAHRRSEEGAPHRGEALLGRTLEDLRDAHAPSDQLAMVQAGLGHIYFDMERYPEASRSWRAALDAGSDPNGTTRRNLSGVLINQAIGALEAGDCRNATDFARQALEVSPLDAKALQILARCGP